jgi:hypothetical protein
MTEQAAGGFREARLTRPSQDRDLRFADFLIGVRGGECVRGQPEHWQI